jgi:hypothetical protein
MNVTFVDKAPEIKKEEDIFVDGKKVGDVAEKGGGFSIRFHAALDFGLGSTFLIQGHGDTREAAITEALSKGRLNAQRLLAEIETYEKKLSS